MKKDEKHERYCCCSNCKPTSRALVILKPGELPLLVNKEAGEAKAAPPLTHPRPESEAPCDTAAQS